MRPIEPKRGLPNSLKVKLKESAQGKWGGVKKNTSAGSWNTYP